MRKILSCLLAAALCLAPVASYGQSIGGGGGGTGTVTSVASGACLTGGPIVSTGTLAGTYVTNAQTGTTYTIAAGDACKLVTFSNGSAVAVTLPAPTGSFAAGFSFDTQNLGAGTVTITPASGTINGASSLAIATNRGCSITSDGTNYQISACTAPLVITSGTVTSVTTTVPSRETATGCVITTSGTCAITDNVQTKNTAFVGPASGSNAAPTFRALVVADLPSIGPTEYLANRWYWMVSNRVSNSGYTANTIRWAPVHIWRAITISNLGMSAFSGAASQNVQLAIYASDASLAPTGAALCATASITVATNVKFSAACAATLTPGLYWFGANVDAASLSLVSQDSTSTTGGSIAGSATEANLAVDASINTLVQYNTSQTFGTWPSSPVITESSTNGANGPMMYFKVSSVP